MLTLRQLPRNTAAVLTFGRPPLVFGAFACALWVMMGHNAAAYLLGLACLLVAMVFDWVDGWFAVRFIPESRLGPVADRMLDRSVYTIIFPVLGAGMFWRLFRLELVGEGAGRAQLIHALFVLAICVLVLLRDQLAHFFRSFSAGNGQQGEYTQLTRLRTLVASPMAVLLYAYAFYLPTERWGWVSHWLSWLDAIPLRILYVVEIFFLVVNIVSITLYLRRYGRLALDDICEDNEILRRRILAVFPNALTLLNGLLGVAGIVFAANGMVREGLLILVGAAFFDKLDGSVARRLGLTEPFPDDVRQPGFRLGPLLDDLSDAVSFCVAPAAIFIIVMENLGVTALPWLPFWVVGLVYALAGFARLVYFTLDKHPIPGFFKGMPVPAAALLTVPVAEIASQLAERRPALLDTWVPIATGVMLLAAVVMNLYPVRYLHFGRWLGRNPQVMWGLLALAAVMVFTPWFGTAMFAVSVVYLFSPLVTGHVDPTVAQLEQPHRAERT